MSDKPTVEKVEKPLTLEERVGILEGDVQELARGINVQGSLLESIVVAFETVVRRYLRLTNKASESEPLK
jgi:hypothetical protein